jgi:hypothetical protein
MLDLILWCALCVGHKKLENPVVKFAVVQAVAEFNDGLSTRHAVRVGYQEIDPVARPLLGPRPTWGRMIPLGITEDISTAWLGERLRQSKRFHHVWWTPQVAAIVLHGIAGGKNWTLTRPK